MAQTLSEKWPRRLEFSEDHCCALAETVDKH